MIEYASHSTYKDESKKQFAYSNLSTLVRSFLRPMSKSNTAIPKLQQTFSSAVSTEISYTKWFWQDRGVSAFHIFTSQMQQIAHSYTLRERTEIFQFFREYPSFIPLLIEAFPKIKKYFRDSQIFLQFVADPDEMGQNNNGDLVVSIVTYLTPLEAVENLEQFYQKWWFYASSDFESSEKICFNLECL